MPDIIEHFFGVYLLYSQNPKYLGRTYIGYTVDPNRRIKQHNKGKKAGGAWRTSQKGPWTMVMIIHGFPNDISALRFEWAWQHPQSSRRLQHLPIKKPKEKQLAYRLRLLSEMLRVGPWNRLPLTVRWLNPDFVTELSKPVPGHMIVSYDAVISKKVDRAHFEAINAESSAQKCRICDGTIVGRAMKCPNSSCGLIGHVNCCGGMFLKVGDYVPVEGKCVFCGEKQLWGDWVRKFNGCGVDGGIDLELGDANEFYSSDSE